MKKLLVPLVILLVSAFILAGCGSETPPAATQPAATTPAATQSTAPATNPAITSPTASQPPVSSPTATQPIAEGKTYGGTMRYITASGPGAPFGVAWLSTGASSFGMQFSMEPLLRGKIDGSQEPFLAESWDIDTKEPSITFHLRKGVKFHDGTDFNAQAVKWNLDKTASQGSTNIGSTTNWKSVDIVDDYTVKITLKTWQNTATNPFSNSIVFMSSPTAFETKGQEWSNWNMVGTGAFLQKEFQRDVKMTYTRNNNYWDPGKPYLDGIDYLFVPDAMTAEALFKSGGGDILQSYSDLMTSRMVQAGYNIISIPGMGSSLIPDSKNPESPWSNVKVRLAAEYAIDKEAIAKAFGYGSWEVLTQAFPKSSPAYDPALEPRKYDVAKAKQLLAEAGYPNGLKTNMYVSPFGTSADIVGAIQAYLKTVGITVELQYPQAGAWSGMMMGTWQNGVLFGPGPMALNPIASWVNYSSGTAWYQSLKKPDDFNELYTAALTAEKLDPALCQKVETSLFNDCTTIPLWVAPTSWATTDAVQDSGLGTRDLFAWFDAQNLWLKK